VALNRLSICCWVLLAAGSAVAAEPLRLNDIQVIGSHNSYKLAMPPANFEALEAARPAIARTLDYSHLPLPDQLDLGVRTLELDVYYDPDGSLFPGRTVSGSRFPVLHVQNLDDRSSCASLVACLRELRVWSERHPRHLPLFISFNAKDAPIEWPGAVVPLSFDEDAWQALDAELLAVLDGRLITPAEVFATGDRRWPLLEEARGRFVTVLDETGAKRRSYASRWRERAMFADLDEGDPGAGILIVNDPVAEFARIQDLVAGGYIVRTRADADTLEARSGDTTRRDAAFASGAQLVSTDYYLPATRFGTSYVVTLPAPGRCNPVRRPDGCLLTE
jgi:hypothetical protein